MTVLPEDCLAFQLTGKIIILVFIYFVASVFAVTVAQIDLRLIIY